MTLPIVAGRADLVLAMYGISKAFGAVAALDDVAFALRQGTVHALVGENGAGKTTLMRIAFRLIQQDRGSCLVAGNSRPLRTPADAITAGLGMVHQHFTNVPAMTVAENVALGGHGRYRTNAASERVAAVAARTGLSLDPRALVGDLSVGAQQRLEIVKALSHAARILILDEPTAVLAPREADELLRWLRDYANDGNAVVLITHKLREALAIADDVTVLRRGRVVLETRAASLTPDALAAALIGTDAGAGASGTASATEPASADETSVTSVVAQLASVSALSDRGLVALQDANVVVRAGEILGIAGVEGAGQRELLRVLAGRLRASSGMVTLPPRIGFVPEDRHRDALVLDFSIAENLALKNAGLRRGRIRWKDLRQRGRDLARAYDVRGGESARHVRELSGGNQQKLILARELDGAPALVVAENPTRGLDFRAAAAVHERLRAAAKSGSAVVVFSSDLDEVLSLATRVMVVHAGRVIECERDREAIGRAMLGVA